MKKLSTRFILLSFLTLASLCSYVFLNTVQTNQSAATTELTVEQSLDSEDETAVMLPDVTLMKKAFELGKRFVRNF